MNRHEPQGRFVRPYAITGGRTEVDGLELALETQVCATPEGRRNRGRYRWEAAEVIGLCETPLAVVEVAARIEIPVGVARVVIADLIGAGAVEYLVPDHEPSYADLLEKVLDGIRNL